MRVLFAARSARGSARRSTPRPARRRGRRESTARALQGRAGACPFLLQCRYLRQPRLDQRPPTVRSHRRDRTTFHTSSTDPGYFRRDSCWRWSYAVGRSYARTVDLTPGLMDALLRDLHYTVRSFRGTLRLSLAAIGCVALGIGGAVFMLTIANAVLVAPPPFPNADRLVRLWTVRDGTGQTGDVSYLEARDVAERARAFDAVEMAARTRTAFTTATGTERVRGESVTAGYFDLIALRPALGRLFTRDEYAPTAPRVIILGHS